MKIKALNAQLLGTLCLLTLGFVPPALASDLDIYKAGQKGDTVLTLMLDASGSMQNMDSTCRDYLEIRYDDDDFGNREDQPEITPVPESDPRYAPYKKYKFNSKTSAGGQTIPGLPVAVCGNNPTLLTRRIDTLRMAVIDAMEGLSDDVVMAIGVYPDFNVANEDSAQGRILVPARGLGELVSINGDTQSASGVKYTQRDLIRSQLADLDAFNGTPAANAYAEAGAYMLGTNTAVDVREVVTTLQSIERRSNGRYDVYDCVSVNTDQTYNIDGKLWYFCNQFSRTDFNVKCNDIKVIGKADTTFGRTCAQSNTSNVYYYGDANIAAIGPFDRYSGFPKSNPASYNANQTRYQSPISEPTSECAGNGIYMLTDGFPNNSSEDIAGTLMTRSLGGSDFSCNDNSLDSVNNGTGWRCMGAFSKKLLNKNNPLKTEIKTATVGFGPLFAQLPSKRDVTFAECNQAAQSAGVTDDNIRNLCRLGSKELGGGGFYYAGNKQDVIDSIKSFVADLKTTIDPVSTGSMAVPVDPLNFTEPRNFAYLPILDPEFNANELWRGNLKKYQVQNGTIVGANSDKVITFQDADGNFSKNTYDFWNASKTVDLAKPQVGGVFSRIFKKLFLDNEATTAVNESLFKRTAFVNDGGELKKLAVAGGKPDGFTALSTQFTNNDKINLLNFLGYDVPAGFNGTTTIDDKTELSLGTGANKVAIPFSESNKVMGGVLHSLPQLITYKANIGDDGLISKDDREDYLLFGSMEGVLRLVADGSGNEQFNFLPTEVLKEQGDVLSGRASQDRFPHGVDAPWQAFATYSVNDEDSNTTAKDVFASGGLGMGGSAYYGLDLTSSSFPKLLYKIGSTYSKEERTGPISGILDALPISFNANTAFSRMGLTMAKPGTGYVMQDGKKVMVNFLPGGYDSCYEDPEFKLSSPVGSVDGGLTGAPTGATNCSTKTVAQGNALYMVKVGETTTDNNNSLRVDLNKTQAGSLMWWTSNTRLGSTGAFTQNTNLKHSIVGEVRVLDRNYDGLTDQLYFTDLGGQVFRVDINNNVDTNNFSVDRVVRVLDVSEDKSGSDTAPRFFERPLVTFERLGPNREIYGVVTVGAGDRSNPLYERSKPNRLYTFIDKDLARNDLYCYNNSSTEANECAGKAAVTLLSQDIRPDDAGGTGSNVLKKLVLSDSGATALKAAMDGSAAQGWYYAITDFDSKAEDGLKVVNEAKSLVGTLLFNVYSPNSGDTVGQCETGIRGLSERRLMCLPYGTCPADTSFVDTRRSGKGIVDSLIVPLNTGDPITGGGEGVVEYGILDNQEIERVDNKCDDPDGCKQSIARVYSDARELEPLEWLQKR